MLAPYEMIEMVSGRHYRKLQKLMSPLVTSLNINYFCWQTVSNTGEWSLLSSRPDWVAYSADEKFYRHDPSSIDPRYYHSGVIYVDTHKHEEFENTLLKASVEKFGFRNSLAVIDKTAQGTEFVFLSCSDHHFNMINVYMNNIAYIKKFTEHFKRECKKEMILMREAVVDIAKLKGQSFYASDNVLDIPRENSYAELIKPQMALTPRERECLLHTTKGLTAKEIGKLMNISHRTVELHLENLRKKFNLTSKRELWRIV